MRQSRKAADGEDLDHLYPEGHLKFTMGQWFQPEAPQTLLDLLADQTSPLACLQSADIGSLMLAWHAEILRLQLYRSALSPADPLPDDDEGKLRWLPDKLRAMLPALNATIQTIDWWLASPTCREIQAQDARRRTAPGK